MRLLVITQALDTTDPVLSAYHRLVSEIARNFDSVTAICLKKGANDLPKNVKVLSLGKEEGGGTWKSRLRYVGRFYRFIFAEKYDAVFVHMNQEYILLGGIFWKLMGKRVYLWRNHHAGSFLTDVAATFCSKVFCTSKFSYTAKYRKTVLMPVGVDTDFFKKDSRAARKPGSILFLARMAPVKKPDLLIDALGMLMSRNAAFNASFYGDPLEKDEAYYASLKEKAVSFGLSRAVSFYPGIPNDKTPETYSSHEIFVNLSSSGMYDKTIFEAMACESLVLATNRNLEGLIDPMFIGEEGDAGDVSRKIEKLLRLTEAEKEMRGKELRDVAVSKHSLLALGRKLAEEVI
ncbi:MAG TPA: glycosyltransferase family 4 protein [Candidatus Paceibacterota bacterium]|nr:glycosyltransferase family 4 protein [Candidatus Paceibacterota bacterium]